MTGPNVRPDPCPVLCPDPLCPLGWHQRGHAPRHRGRPRGRQGVRLRQGRVQVGTLADLRVYGCLIFSAMV